ncbi:MAG: helix-turn-helix domain-containing protein [Alphaproteobacteria bacterium]|nr:helix-turn-helix domain-containing protein [Alphaproteobacteria bacterium]
MTAPVTTASPPLGTLLKRWRAWRGLSQLECALSAGVSPRHLSFVETGRAQPSRAVVASLAAALDLPLRERNALLVAAGYAAAYPETPLDDASLALVNEALDRLLAQQEPYPALVVDRCWNLLRANAATQRIAQALLGAGTPPATGRPNLLRMVFDPGQLRPHIENWDEAAVRLLRRAHGEGNGAHDRELSDLIDELLAFPGVPRAWRTAAALPVRPPILAIRFRRDALRMAWFSMMTTLGTPEDVTLQELRIESFFPADGATAALAAALARNAVPA